MSDQSAANAVTSLLAKSVLETVTEVQHESRSQSTKKGNPMGKKQLRRALAQAEAALSKAGVDWNRGADPMAAETLARSSPPIRLGAALDLMKRAADDAQRVGDVAKASGLRQEIATIKMQVAERHRQERPTPSRLGPGTVELFSRTGHLAADPQVGGI